MSKATGRATRRWESWRVSEDPSGNEAEDSGVRDRALAGAISKAISRIKFGSVEIILQDSRVIQVNTIEKIRVDRSND